MKTFSLAICGSVVLYAGSVSLILIKDQQSTIETQRQTTAVQQRVLNNLLASHPKTPKGGTTAPRQCATAQETGR